MVGSKKPRAIGFNHVALEVGDIDEAPAFYGRIFDFQLRGKSGTMAFIDLGDQFIALQAGRKQLADDGRHVGLVVDDKAAARAALRAAGVKPIGGPFLDFRDPWGNRIEIVSYDNIQVHQGSKRSARHRPGAIDEERKRENGAGGKRDGGELECLCTPYDSPRKWLGYRHASFAHGLLRLRQALKALNGRLGPNSGNGQGERRAVTME
jgi:lactoylglutathione lyase